MWVTLGQECLDRHFRLNDHHPEFSDTMSEEARMELTCDLLGSVYGNALKHGYSSTLAECRAVIEYQQWHHWKEAFLKGVPEASRIVPSLPNRWILFPTSEYAALKKLYHKYQEEKEIRKELCELQSVKYFMDDLYWHRVGVERTMLLLKARVSEFSKISERIRQHDVDLYDTLMILGCTVKWCF